MTSARSHLAGRWRNGAAKTVSVSRELAQETPVALSFNGRAHAVLMATPQDIEDLATGFMLGERIAAFDQLRDVRVEVLLAGIQVDVRIDGEPSLRERRTTANSSCGLCGVQDLRDALRPLPVVEGGFRLSRKAIHRALAELEEGQVLGGRTRATHAAGLAEADGALRLVREDVGRHNALDKLVGAARREGLSVAERFVVITSRCSYEMVEKAALAGCPALVAVSAPTALAVERAQEAGLTLAALARADGHTVFCGFDRVVE